MCTSLSYYGFIAIIFENALARRYTCLSLSPSLRAQLIITAVVKDGSGAIGTARARQFRFSRREFFEGRAGLMPTAASLVCIYYKYSRTGFP